MPQTIWYLRCAMLHEGAAILILKRKTIQKNAKKEVKDIVPISSLKQPEKSSRLMKATTK